MKTPRLVCFFLLFATVNLDAQMNAAATAQPQDTPYSVVSRDAHSSTWEKTSYELGSSGEWVPHLHRYVETATGLNYWDPSAGQFEPSSETIVLSSTGAVAQHGQHKVTFASDLSASDSIDIETPDGQMLKTRLLGLSYYDSASGQSVLIAEITNCAGQIVAPNQVWYDNAFSGVKAGVRYTYTRGGFEQDIVLEECPAAPEAYGLSSASTILQALTEVISAPEPTVTTNYVLAAPGFQMEDQTMLFGNMKVGNGLAFVMGKDSKAARVTKEWLNLDGRQFLVEEVPMPQVAKQLQTLPSRPSVSSKRSSSSVLNVVSTRRLLPARPLARMATQPMKVASVSMNKAGFVLDYVTLNASQTNMVFQGDTTYYVSGNVNLYGTSTEYEGGTVLKYATNAGITLNTPLTWLGAPYRPVVMTAKDDNSVGEGISGSTGIPTNYYASYALRLLGNNGSNSFTLNNLRISFANIGIQITAGANVTLFNGQFLNGNCGLSWFYSGGSVTVENGLFASVLYPFDLSLLTATNTVLAENVTFSSNTDLIAQPVNPSDFYPNEPVYEFTNCIFANVVTNGVSGYQFYGASNGAYNVSWSVPGGINSSQYPFQTVGAGSYYLSNSCVFHNAGTTNIDPVLQAELQQKTTYAPVVYSNTTISATEFSPQAQRDTNTPPDLGYHYDPLDWVFGGVTANGNLTFDAGTAVGWFQTVSGNGYGMQLANHVTNTFNGTVTAPCVFARYDTVQEGGNGNWRSEGWLAGISTVGNSSYFAEIDAKFAHCYHLAGDPNHFRDYLAQLNVHANHSEFHSGSLAGYWLGQFMTNCLYDRLVEYGSQQKSAGLFWRNCTMHGGQVFVIHSTDPYWPVWIENCAFDGTTTNMDLNTNTYCNYNAFLNGAQRLVVQGANDIVTNPFTWQTGPLGTFYQATSSPLIDKGSVTADVVGLYHFTTTTNEVKETNSIVDIGYHYVALDANGNPLDTNGDGIPDYLEDSNGNGVWDPGIDLGDWKNTSPDTSGAINLQVYTPLH